MQHAGISTQYQKHVAKVLYGRIMEGWCAQGTKRRHARTVIGEYVKSDLQGKYRTDQLSGKDIRKDLQNVYQLLNVYTELRKGKIHLSEADFETLDASKLALLSPFLSVARYQPKLNEAVELAKYGTAREMRELKKKC